MAVDDALSDRSKYRLSLLLPVALLTISFLVAPRIFAVSAIADDLQALTDVPTLLYRRDGLAVYYTSNDLLHPEAFGSPGQFIQGIVFDVTPRNEGDTKRLSNLTWVRQIIRALDVRNFEGRLDTERHKHSDQDLAKSFQTVFVRNLELDRGTAALFLLPERSTYRTISGIKAVVAAAVKDPGKKRLRPDIAGEPQLLDSGLRQAFLQLTGADISGAGVPYMAASDGLGRFLPQTQSWERLLTVVENEAAAAGLRTVVLGGFGLSPQNRGATDRRFRDAWTNWRPSLAAQLDQSVHEPIRLTGIILLFALVAFWLQAKAFTWKRLLAIAITAAALSAAVTAVFAWLSPLTADLLSREVGLLIKILASVMAGTFVSVIIRFDSKKVLSDV